MRRTYSLFYLIPVLSLLVLSCAADVAGYGVLLASPEEDQIESGSVVTIIAESEVTRSYVITADELEENLQLPQWRVAAFDTRDDAERYRDEYQAMFDGNTTLYARAGRNALPIRSMPTTAGTNTVYRLRDGEVVKLISREDEKTDLSGLVSYWYEALTQTGERGWVFGYTLEVFDPTDESIVMSAPSGQDPLRELLLQNIWRPIWYTDMIANSTIDLAVFTPQYGLFPDPERNQIELVLPWHTTLFEYEQILSVGPRRYFAEGTTLQMSFQRNDELSVQYSLDGQEYIQSFQRIDGEVSDYVEQERTRRAEIYENLLAAGPVFLSDNYGTLELLPGQRFRWTDYNRLVPSVVPSAAGSTGSINLGLFLASDLLQRYDGALSFRFDGVSPAVHFVYSIRDNGVRLVYVPPQAVDDRLVSEPGSTLTVFMSSTGG